MFFLPEKSDPEKLYLSAQGLKLQKRGQHNSVFQTRQSLTSQITFQIVGSEINLTFRYNPKKVRRAWGISQVIIDLI